MKLILDVTTTVRMEVEVADEADERVDFDNFTDSFLSHLNDQCGNVQTTSDDKFDFTITEIGAVVGTEVIA